MADPPLEIEAKFIVAGLEAIRVRLGSQSARRIEARHREVNLRFDLPDGALRSSGRVLRVRDASAASLTFKAPGPDAEHRIEIEVGIDDAGRGRQLLEALGYRVVFVYEKEREVYQLGEARVMLDELPFGTFVEIEANDIDRVRQTSERLGLQWEDRVALTYLGLFESLSARLRWTAREATFEAFRGLEPLSVEELARAAKRS